jgi:glycosyltransferase involved in cell wall biosynthesis
MACGAFPIVTEIPSNREWIVDNQNGFLVPIDDEGILARKIIEAIRRPERMIEVSDKNRKVVQESARWETIISKTGRIYEGLSG